MAKTRKRNALHNVLRISDPTYELARKKKEQSGRPMWWFIDRAMKKAYPLEYKQALQRVQENERGGVPIPGEDSDIE